MSIDENVDVCYIDLLQALLPENSPNDLVRLDKPLSLNRPKKLRKNGSFTCDMNAGVWAGTTDMGSFTGWVAMNWDACFDDPGTAPSWTWSFWARVENFGAASALTVMAKTFPDSVSGQTRSSWKIVLYQNGNFGLEAEGLGQVRSQPLPSSRVLCVLCVCVLCVCVCVCV